MEQTKRKGTQRRRQKEGRRAERKRTQRRIQIEARVVGEMLVNTNFAMSKIQAQDSIWVTVSGQGLPQGMPGHTAKSVHPK